MCKRDYSRFLNKKVNAVDFGHEYRLETLKIHGQAIDGSREHWGSQTHASSRLGLFGVALFTYLGVYAVVGAEQRFGTVLLSAVREA